MNLTFVEMLIVGAAFELALKNPIVPETPWSLAKLPRAAREVVWLGAKKLGFRYTPGILRDDWDGEDSNGFYERASALRLFEMYMPKEKTR